MPALPGSGNFVVDAQEEAEELEAQRLHTLSCGCYKRCTCDDTDEE